ncbi:MAG: phytoene/squalene synthase family protein [Bacteroidetes bacterium]|nr:phytoene/squalene synthase family protein [Bacteroidota bacterium]
MSIKIYNDTSFKISDIITRSYSTSFSLAIRSFSRELQDSITAIYAFVRIADEIVDTFHESDKITLLNDLKKETFNAIENEISVNPVLHSFQMTVNNYEIPLHYIHSFLESMEMDIYNNCYDRENYDRYVYGSAEVVGLMCLRVFCYGDDKLFEELKEPAKALGSAFQKVNFLRDIKNDLKERKRIYLPDAENTASINSANKQKLEKEIEKEFAAALKGIKQLPDSSRIAVLSAYQYYYMLFKKIRKLEVEDLFLNRVSVSNVTKILLLLRNTVRLKLSMFF